MADLIIRHATEVGEVEDGLVVGRGGSGSRDWIATQIDGHDAASNATSSINDSKDSITGVVVGVAPLPQADSDTSISIREGGGAGRAIATTAAMVA